MFSVFSINKWFNPTSFENHKSIIWSYAKQTWKQRIGYEIFELDEINY
jgi:hypothetical protein